MRLPMAAGPAHRVSARTRRRRCARLFGLTAGVGGFAAVIALTNGQLPLTAIPTLVLIGCLLVGAPVVVAGLGAGERVDSSSSLQRRGRRCSCR